MDRDKIAGYNVIGVLGKGGMGIVYIGFDRESSRLVAIKTLSKELAGDKMAVRRFLREAELYARLKHPHIVESYGSGIDRGQHYIALEYIQGRDVSTLIKRSKGGLPPVLALDILRSLLSALVHAHSLGIVHRDIKPHNVIVNPFGVCKLLDFGVAQVADASVSLTKTGMIVGTLIYGSPEQNQGKTVDESSDVYSVGVMLYEMLTGRRLFKGGNVGEIVIQQIKLSRVEISAEVEGLPAEFDDYLSRMLAPMKKIRFEDAKECLEALDAMLDELDPAVRKRLIGGKTVRTWTLAREAYLRGDYELSRNLLRSLLEGGTRSVELHLLEGRIARELQDRDGMVRAFTEVVRLDPTNVPARLEFILALHSMGMEDLVSKQIEALLSIKPDDVVARGLARIFRTSVKWVKLERTDVQRLKSIEKDVQSRSGVSASGTGKAESAEEEAARREKAEDEYAARIVAGILAEASEADPSAVEGMYYLPGLALYKAGERNVGLLYMGVAAFLLVTAVWVLTLDFSRIHLPLYDFLYSWAPESLTIQAIEGAWEETLNDLLHSSGILVKSFTMALVLMGYLYLGTVSTSRAVGMLRRRALTAPVTGTLGEDKVVLGIGADRGVRAGMEYDVFRIASSSRTPVARVRVLEAADRSSIAYVERLYQSGEEALRPSKGDVAFVRRFAEPEQDEEPVSIEE